MSFLSRRRFAALCLIAAAVVAGCASSPATDTARPRLVVLLVFDGLPQRQVVDYREQLAPDGLRRFLDRGAWFSDAHFGQAVTQTAPGHATFLTGAYPHRTGIIANEWRDPASGKRTYNTGDTAATYIGHKTEELDGTSPRNLRVESLGDVLRRLDARSKVIAISGKDRGAILPAGKMGIAYMYQASTGQFASTTHYMPDHPSWVKEFHAGKPADAYYGREWKPLLEESAYRQSLADDQKWFLKGGGRLPMKIGGDGFPDAPFYSALLRSPYGDELTFAFARAAVKGEALGADDAPDILSVSLSTHDYVNHAYSAESRISHDHVLHVDRQLEAFFRYLDETVGKDRYVAVLTADHGFTPSPEYFRSLGRDAGRVSGSGIVTKLNAALAKRFGEGQWVLGLSAQAVVLNRALIAERKVDIAAASEESRKVLLAEPGIAAVFTRSEIESGSGAGSPFFDAVRKSFDRERSADLPIVLKPNWLYTSSSSIASHGHPHPADTHVPLLFYGPAWVTPGRRDGRVEIVDIAPTLARMLGVPEPAACEGKPLPVGVRTH